MILISQNKVEIIRTERGLTISGTRLSLYEIMDFLKADYPPQLIQHKFNLTDAQIKAALSYLETHSIEVEKEYQQVLQTREEIRNYWEQKNGERFARIANIPHKPEQKDIWTKLEKQKAQQNTEG